MTAYIAITDAETDPEAPLTSELAKKWRDNPIAIAEGASNAPVNTAAWHPYNKVFNNDSNTGVIWSFAANGSVSAITTPNFVDGWEYSILLSQVQAVSSSADLVKLSLYKETSAALATTTISTTIGSIATYSYSFDLLGVRVSKNVHAATSVISAQIGNTVGSSTEANRLFIDTTPQKILYAVLSLGSTSSGSTQFFDGTNAQAVLYKRKRL